MAIPSYLPKQADIIGMWKFNGNSTDESPSANHGADTDISYVAGKFGDCASFNGASSIITLDDILDGATTFTFSTWINKAAVGNGSGLLYYKDDCLMFGNYDGSDHFRFRVRNNVGAGTWGATADVNYPYNIDTWHMCTGTFNSAGGADNLKLYMDGVLWQEGTLAAGVVQGGTAFVLGGRATEYFDGKMDETVLWDIELTAAEITGIYLLRKAGGFSGFSPWIFMKDMWEKHNKIWRPKGKILIPQGI